MIKKKRLSQTKKMKSDCHLACHVERRLDAVVPASREPSLPAHRPERRKTKPLKETRGGGERGRWGEGGGGGGPGGLFKKMRATQCTRVSSGSAKSMNRGVLCSDRGRASAKTLVTAE